MLFSALLHPLHGDITYHSQFWKIHFISFPWFTGEHQIHTFSYHVLPSSPIWTFEKRTHWVCINIPSPYLNSCSQVKLSIPLITHHGKWYIAIYIDTQTRNLDSSSLLTVPTTQSVSQFLWFCYFFFCDPIISSKSSPCLFHNYCLS